MTEAKDTVKTGIELCLIVCQEYQTLNLEGKDCIGLDCDVCQLNKQAEITAPIFFEEGRKAGEKQGYEKGIKDRLREIDALIQRLKTRKQDGIREVVEELRQREVYAYAASPSGVHLVNLEMLEDWQAQLKDWGIK